MKQCSVVMLYPQFNNLVEMSGVPHCVVLTLLDTSHTDLHTSVSRDTGDDRDELVTYQQLNQVTSTNTGTVTVGYN